MAYSKRVAAGTIFGKWGLATAMSRAKSLYQRDIRILIYHRVVAPSRAYDVANVSSTPEQFAQQLDYIAKSYDVIGFQDLAACYSGTQQLPRRPLLITFDDGFADNYEFAFPELAKRNLTAAFFVVTSQIGKEQLYWFDKVGFLIKSTKEQYWDLLDGSTIKLTGDQAATCRDLLERLKMFSNQKRIEQLQLLEERTLDGSETVDQINFPMTWEQLEEMHKNGMEIYSHTDTHPVLSMLDDEDEIRRELTVSQALIEERLGNDCSVFAYPNGRWSSYNSTTLKLVEECGYEIACINETGINSLDKTNKLELLRIPVDAFHNINSFKSLIGQPEWFSY